MSATPTTPAITYKRLPGRVWVPTGMRKAGSVWLGPDHILAVIENGYAENYKRFYLADIQGFIVHRTSRRRTLNIVLGIFLAAIFGFSWLVGGEMTTAVFMTFAVGLIFWVGILVNSLSGPTCEVRVRTAVQTEIIAPLQRIRSFEKFYERVRPLIIQAQGELDPTQSGDIATYASPEPLTPPPLKPFSPRLHLWFFGLLAATCFPGFLLFFASHPVTAAAYYILALLALALSFGSIVRQHSENCLDSALISLSWFGGILALVNGIVHYFEMLFFTFSSPQMLSGGYGAQWEFLRVDPSEYDFLFWHLSIFLFLAWGIGMFGFIRAWQSRPIQDGEASA